MDKNVKTKRICLIIIPILLLTLGLYQKARNIPTTIFLREGQELKSNHIIKLVEEEEKREKKNNVKLVQNKIIYDYDKVNVSFFGLLPVKSVAVKSVPQEIKLYPGGQPVGVKLNTKGVLVVALSDIETTNGNMVSPAANAGIEIGDSIIKINNIIINNSEQLSKEINNAEGKEITLIIERKGVEIKKIVKPIINSKDNKYKLGLWVRDSTAGVGTLTFYDEKSGVFAALGHPITDVDTGTILGINRGEIVSSSIISIRKGLKGSPGELKGIFVDEDMILGHINKNTECGIFGNSTMKLNNNVYNKPLGIALRNEIKQGPAKILTTLEGNEPKLYDIEIEKLLSQDTPGPKSMVIKVTDPELLEKTGGIVQGMSGSPIIQDDKIIGAVTHVLINKPEVGYGIYIEWMLKDADILKQ